MERDLTTGSVFRNVILFSLPYLLSYFLQTLYGMADLFIIGQFDSVAGITAVSIGSQVMHMLTVMVDGNNCQYSTGSWQQGTQKGSKMCGKYSDFIYGSFHRIDGTFIVLCTSDRSDHVNSGRGSR